MSDLKYSNSSQARRRIAGVFTATFIGVVALLLFGAYPLQRRRSDLRERINQMDSRIESYIDLSGEQPLARQVAEAQRRNGALANEWQRLKSRVRTFDKDARLADILASSEEGRIDYKVALYDARQRVSKRAGLENVAVPPSLGMKETIDTDEVMESKLWQLASNVKLVEQIIDSRPDVVESIDVLNPIVFSLTPIKDSYMLLYPLKMRIVGTYASLLSLSTKLESDNSFYAPQRMLVERLKPGAPGELGIESVYSAIQFRNELPRLEEDEPEIDAGGRESDMTNEPWGNLQ